MYGTFSTIPPQFLQLYTIHGIHHVRNVVRTYRLLGNKRQETYTEKLKQLKHLTNNVIPHSIMIGFKSLNRCIKSKTSFSPTKSLLISSFQKHIPAYLRTWALNDCFWFLKVFGASHSFSKVYNRI